MTRTDVARLILQELEKNFDGLVHVYGPNGDRDYSPADVVDAIVRITSPWSREIEQRGGYDAD